MINSCITFPKTTLVFFNYIVGLDKAREAIVNKCCKKFPKNNSKL